MKEIQKEIYPLNLEDVGRIELIGYGGEVSVFSGNEIPELEIFRKGKIQIHIEKKKNVLRISTETSLFSSESAEARIHLKIPEGMEIKILGESVPVRMKGSFGNVRIIGNEGDIRLEDASGSFSIISAKGDIVLRNLQGEVSASTQDGDIIAHCIFGKYKLISSTGTMTLSEGEGSFTLFSKYVLRIRDVRFRKGLENRLYCKGGIHLSGLSSLDPSVIHISAPAGKISTELGGFGISGSGRRMIATSFGPEPSMLRLHSDEEVFISSSDRFGMSRIAV